MLFCSAVKLSLSQGVGSVKRWSEYREGLFLAFVAKTKNAFFFFRCFF